MQCSQKKKKSLEIKITKYSAVDSTIADHNYMPNVFHYQS